jgi:hypothetical protein
MITVKLYMTMLSAKYPKAAISITIFDEDKRRKDACAFAIVPSDP